MQFSSISSSIPNKIYRDEKNWINLQNFTSRPLFFSNSERPYTLVRINLVIFLKKYIYYSLWCTDFPKWIFSFLTIFFFFLLFIRRCGATYFKTKGGCMTREQMMLLSQHFSLLNGLCLCYQRFSIVLDFHIAFSHDPVPK